MDVELGFRAWFEVKCKGCGKIICISRETEKERLKKGYEKSIGMLLEHWGLSEQSFGYTPWSQAGQNHVMSRYFFFVKFDSLIQSV